MTGCRHLGGEHQPQRIVRRRITRAEYAGVVQCRVLELLGESPRRVPPQSGRRRRTPPGTPIALGAELGRSARDREDQSAHPASVPATSSPPALLRRRLLAAGLLRRRLRVVFFAALLGRLVDLLADRSAFLTAHRWLAASRSSTAGGEVAHRGSTLTGCPRAASWRAAAFLPPPAWRPRRLAGGLAEAARPDGGVAQLLDGIDQALRQHVEVAERVPISGQADEHLAVVGRHPDGQQVPGATAAAPDSSRPAARPPRTAAPADRARW